MNTIAPQPALLQRRTWLKRFAATAAGAAAMPQLLSDALAQQEKPRTAMIHTLAGDVRVNERPATVGTAIRSGDTLIAGSGSYATWTLESDAFLIRQNSHLVISGAQNAATLFRLVTGRLLSVFAKGGQRTLAASTATIGIRGTGAYLEAYPDRAYLCLCYGAAEIDIAGAKESLVSRYHETPRVIYADNRPSPIITGPVVNHSDAELIMLEALLGRRPPQDFFDNVRY